MKRLLLGMIVFGLMSTSVFAMGESEKAECKFTQAALSRAESANVEKEDTKSKTTIKKEKEAAAGE